MAISAGSCVISAGVFNSATGAAGAADLSKGTLCPEGVVLGIFLGGTSPATFVDWSNGNVASNGFDLNALREVTPYTGTDLLGKRVTLPGTGPAFRGVVAQQFNTELDDTGGAGNQSPVCVVKANGFYYIAEPNNLLELN